MTTLTGMDELREARGRELGRHRLARITQAEVDAFAEVTGDTSGSTPARVYVGG